MRKSSCNCASRFEIDLGRPDEYTRCKTILNEGKHPVFIGRDLVKRCAANGGLLFVQHNEIDVAVAIVNAHHNVLLVLNIIPTHRSHGLGSAIVEFIMPNFVRAIEDRVGFFNKLNYVSVGKKKKGIKFKTQIMIRRDLIPLAGRVSRILGARRNTA